MHSLLGLPKAVFIVFINRHRPGISLLNSRRRLWPQVALLSIQEVVEQVERLTKVPFSNQLTRVLSFRPGYNILVKRTRYWVGIHSVPSS